MNRKRFSFVGKAESLGLAVITDWIVVTTAMIDRSDAWDFLELNRTGKRQAVA